MVLKEKYEFISILMHVKKYAKEESLKNREINISKNTPLKTQKIIKINAPHISDISYSG